MLAYLLQHLIFCAVHPHEHPECRTHLLLPGQSQTLADIPQAAARAQLAQWLAYFRLGQSRPLPFFAKTGLAVAEVLSSNKADSLERAQQTARSEYRGSKKCAVPVFFWFQI